MVSIAFMRNQSAVWCLATGVLAVSASAQDVSAPAILQWFDSSYGTQEERLADFFMAGYGSTWVPPVSRADTGGLSVGYDVFDRFDLGKTNSPTLYGTETGLRALTSTMRRMGGSTIVDLVLNHSGFRDASTPDFLTEGGYPGLLLQTLDANGNRIPGTDGDYHGRFETGDLNFRLSGLVDLKHETNLQYIRTPVDPSDPRNIPAGTRYNIADPSNARFYTDRQLPGTTYFNPLTGQNVTHHAFNTSNPLAGDAVPENATGLLMRNARWLIQDVGVDGFRLDAARHFEPWLYAFYDEAVYRASTRTLLDGSAYHTYTFSEGATTDKAELIGRYTRKTINPNQPNTIGGNRDALDFAQFWPVKQNLSSNGLGNDWRNVVYEGLDVFDDGLVNGSSGVVFVESHDDFGPDLIHTAYAYSLLRPGNAVVHYNADEHSNPLRDFPKDGRFNALGNGDDRITKLVDLRNRYGRGDYRERFLEKENYAYERSKSALVLLSNRSDAGFDSRTIAVDFAPGTWLVEQTGNAEHFNTQNGNNDLARYVQVQGTPGNAFVNARFARGGGQDRGYLVYAVQTPQSDTGLEIVGASTILAGDTPAQPTGAETPEQLAQLRIENARARLTDLHVITGNSFTVRLATDAVSFNVPGLGNVRDVHADGDFAMVRINEGLDLNGNGVVDSRTPNSVTYGFENFTTTFDPGFFNADGNGLYEQLIDASQLTEGMHFVTARAFRHRNTASGGDGGPAVYTDFKQVLYVDRLKAISEVDALVPFSSNGKNIDFRVKSTDQTADQVFTFLNVGAAIDDATILGWVNTGDGQASQIDRDIFQRGYFDVRQGNNVLTIVTREITGNTNIQRITGIDPLNNNGRGFGDLNGDGLLSGGDIANAPNNFETILYSRNAQFRAAADGNADGLVDTRDLLLLRPLFTTPTTQPSVVNLYNTILRRRGDMNATGSTNGDDIDALHARIGNTGDTWLEDLNVDGMVTAADVDVLLFDLLRSNYGDANTDGQVNLIDAAILANNFTGRGGTGRGWKDGSFDFDGDVDFTDAATLRLNYLGGATASEPGDASVVLEVDLSTGTLTLMGNAVLSAWSIQSGASQLATGDAATSDSDHVYTLANSARELAAISLTGLQLATGTTLDGTYNGNGNDLTFHYALAGSEALAQGVVRVVPEPATAAALMLITTLGSMRRRRGCDLR